MIDNFYRAINAQLEKQIMQALDLPPHLFESQRGAAQSAGVEMLRRDMLKELRHALELTKPEVLCYARYILCNPYSDGLASILTLAVRYRIDVVAHSTMPLDEVLIIYSKDKPK